MKILVLNWRDYKHPLTGGAEVALLKHVSYWQKKGASITWFGSSYPGAKREEVLEGITYIRRGSQYTVHLHAILYFVGTRIKEFDIVIDNFHFIPFFTPLYCNKNKIIAFIHEVAGKIWYKNLPLLPAFIGYHLEPFYFMFYKKIQFITVSNSTKKELQKMKIPKENITIIPNGSSSTIKISHKKESIPTILFLGRLSEDKGINDALKVFKILKDKHQKTKFWIVGKEEKKGIFESLMKNYPEIKNDTEYFGYIDEYKKYELLRRSWLLIHPSAKEGWGLTVLEAASQGTPTVGYNVEGLRDSIVSNKTGILTENEPKFLTNAIQKLLTNKGEYKKMCEEAEKWSKQFDWGKSAKNSWELINNQYNNI